MTELVSLLDKLQELPPPALSVWTMRLLTFNRTEPECICQGDLAHLRLIKLIQGRSPEITIAHQMTQATIKEAVASLYGIYHPKRQSDAFGSELLFFAQAINDYRGLLRFNDLLCHEAFDYSVDSQRRLLREAQWSVAATVHDWERTSPWIIRHAMLRNNSRAHDERILEVAISALGVWCAFGPLWSLHELLEAVPVVLLSGSPATEELVAGFRQLLKRLRNTRHLKSFMRHLERAVSEEVGSLPLASSWNSFLRDAGFTLGQNPKVTSTWSPQELTERLRAMSKAATG